MRVAVKAAGVAPHAPTRGYDRLFTEHVMQAPQGCDFDFLVGAVIPANINRRETP